MLAQYHLGTMYETGRGVPLNFVEAVKWYRKAAERGHGRAQLFLGGKYEYGIGVPQDLLLAHMWYSLGSRRGSSEEERKRAASARDELARKLSPEQLALAQKMTKEWKPNKGK